MLDENDHHQCYLGIGLALSRNPFIKEAISNIHRMSHPLLRPQFLNEAEISATPVELLSRDFLSELGVDRDNIPSGANSEKHLKTSVKKALTAANFPQDETDEIMTYLFNSSPDNFSPFSITGNDNARRIGFASLSSFKAGLTVNNFDERLKHYIFDITAPNLAGLAKLNPLILTDEPAFFYRNLLARFCKTSRARGGASSTPADPPLLHPRIEEIANKTRRNAVRLLTHQPKTCSLNSLAGQELTLHRYIRRKMAGLIVKTGDKRVLGQDQLSVYNCFLCPATVKEPIISPTEIHESLADFARVDPSVPYINYKRLFPYDSAKEILLHVHSDHLGTIDEGECSLIIPCKTCIQLHMVDPDKNPLESAFVCCAKCGLDHFRILHSNSNKLLALYSSLEADFRHNSSAKELLERHLLTECFACGALFKTDTLMKNHQLECISSFSSLSSGYGRSLASEIFFTNGYIKRKEDERLFSHAIDRLTQLVQILQSRNSSRTTDTLPEESASALLASIVSPPSIQQRDKGKGGKRGTSKSTKKITGRLPPGLDSSDEEVELLVEIDSTTNDNDGILRREAETPATSVIENNNLEEDDDVWIEAEHNRRIALLQSSPPCVSSVRLCENDDAASTVLKAEMKGASSLSDNSILDFDHYCTPPPAKKKHTL